MDAHTTDWLKLLLAPGLGPKTIDRAITHFGSVAAAVAGDSSAWAQAQGVGARRAQNVAAWLRSQACTDAIDDERRAVESANAWVLTIDQPDYPRLLKLIPDPPPVLFGQGELREDDAVALAIVGSRKCSTYGREQADRFAAAAALAGMTIVSGGAFGIDAVAHRATLRAGGRTIAVLGSGLIDPYPADNRTMFADIAHGAGAVVTELTMNASVRRENFPRRNRIISGLSLGVLVVEAALRSGALITARQAGDDHNREVMALPGRIDSPTSAGCLQLIRSGAARLVTSPAEVMDDLGEAGQLLKASLPEEPSDIPSDNPASSPAASLFNQPGNTNRATSAANASSASSASSKKPAASTIYPAASPVQQQILDTLDQPMSIDQLVERASLPAHVIMAELTILELRSQVQRIGRLLQRRR